MDTDAKPGDGTQPTDAASPGGDKQQNTETQLFLKNEQYNIAFKTEQDVVNSLVEAQRTISTRTQENQELKQQLRLAERVGELEARTAQPEPKPDPGATREKVIKRWVDKGLEEDVAVEIYEDFNAMGAGWQALLDDARKEIRTELLGKIQDVDPRFASAKEKILGLQTKYGVSRDKAIELHAEMETLKQPVEENRPEPPGNTSGGMAPVEEKTAKFTLGGEEISPEEALARQEARVGKLTDAEKAKFLKGGYGR